MNFNTFNKYLHFIHPNISFTYDNNQISTIASEPIDKGVLIMLEEGIVGKTKEVIRKMSFNEDLNALLYPRENTDNKSDFEFNRQKYNYNAFEWNEKEKTFALFYTISRINHRCNPNSFVVEVINHRKPLFALFTVKDIKQGDEISISYGEDIGHSNHTIFNWKCECELDKIQRLKTFTKNQKLASDYLKFEYHYLDFLLNCYHDDEEVWEEENDIQNSM
uniref:SET domain-containing protein n=1 Tax=viral metagenome TaxID=1070528 RepID=A0A6C0HDP8_9ZZZZ